MLLAARNRNEYDKLKAIDLAQYEESMLQIKKFISRDKKDEEDEESIFQVIDSISKNEESVFQAVDSVLENVEWEKLPADLLPKKEGKTPGKTWTVLDFAARFSTLEIVNTLEKLGFKHSDYFI